MQHVNHVTGYQFKGDKAKPLAAAIAAHHFGSAEWATLAQAYKVGLTPTHGAHPVHVMLNEKAFAFYNLDQLEPRDPTPAEEEEMRIAFTVQGECAMAREAIIPAGVAIGGVITPDRPEENAFNRLSLREFKAGLPNGGKGMTAEAAAFHAGLPNGGTYTVHMGYRNGEFLEAAMRLLADNGDAEGRRYTLDVEQVGWAVYTAFTEKGKPLARPQLVGTYPMGSDSRKLEAYQQAGMAYPTNRLTLKPIKE